jgi:large subunit ribosomal protein L30
MTKIKVTQIRSQIGCSDRQRRTLEALGLGRISKSHEFESTPQILGMIDKVKHIISVENL